MFSFRKKDENFPTSPPGKPTAYQSSPTTVTLEFDKPSVIGENVKIEGYRITIQCIESEIEIPAAEADEDGFVVADIDDLEPESEYRFSVTALCPKNRESAESEVSDVVKTASASKPPSKPSLMQTSATSVLVKWSPPEMGGLPVVGYKVLWEEEETAQKGEVAADKHPQKEVHDLCPGCSYKFWVKAVCSKGESPEGEKSDPILLIEKVKDRLVVNSKLIKNSIPSIHQLMLVETSNSMGGKIRKCHIGRPVPGASEKVVMVVGATGAGKTTLINGMINYIVGVDWDDKFRFKLIADQEEIKIKNQSKSQTQWITSYTVHFDENFKIPYTLTVIDTPGFGDTSGIKRDREITDQIRTFFTTKGETGIDHLDAIGFVVQSALPRLTPIQNFIFDSVLNLFGKDIVDNIYLMITFGDGGRPPVLAGIKEAKLPYKKYFKFNNSALFAATDMLQQDANHDGNDIEFTKMFWEMGEESYQDFFNSLNSTVGKSLQLSEDVMNERHRLEAYLNGINVQMQSNMTTLDKLRTEQVMMTRHEKDIENNKAFTYKVQEEIIVQEKIPKWTYVTNCLQCNFSCHFPCHIPDKDKRNCLAMVYGKCKVCPQKCDWTVHKNMDFRYVTKRQTTTKNYGDLKKRYEDAEGRKMTAKEIIESIKEEFRSVQIYMLYLVGEMKASLERLSEIAAKPSRMSHIDLIDNLIQSEEQKHEPGFQDRVRILKDVRRDAPLLFQIDTNDFDDFQEFKQRVIQQKNRQAYNQQAYGYRGHHGSYIH